MLRGRIAGAGIPFPLCKGGGGVLKLRRHHTCTGSLGRGGWDWGTIVASPNLGEQGSGGALESLGLGNQRACVRER